MARSRVQPASPIRRAAALICCAALSAWLAGCGGGGGSGESLPPGDKPPRQGSVRVVNLIPDAPQLAPFLSANPVKPIDFGQASALTKYLVAIYQLNVEYIDPAGDVTEVENVADIELTQEKEISFYLMGTWASPMLLRVDNVEIDFGVTPHDNHLNEASVQVVHGATTAGPVDVYLTPAGADLATAAPIATGVAFGQFSPLVTIAPNDAWEVRVTDPGTTNVLFDSGPFPIQGFTRSVFVVRDNFGPGGHPWRVSLVTADGGFQFPKELWATSMRFGNFIPDAPSVDAYLNATTNPPTFTNAQYAQIGARTSVPPGGASVPLKVAATGTTTPLVVDALIPIPAGIFQTELVGGLAAGALTAPLSIFDDIRMIATEARVTFAQLATQVGAVDVYILPPGVPTTDVTPTLPGLAAKSFSHASLLPGSYDVTITRSGSQTVLVGPERISVELGANLYTLALTDSDGGGLPLVLRRYDDLAP
jgi:uncharacterized protein DUF4397